MKTKQELIDFEENIKAIYEQGKIKGPIHLRDGNEDELIKIFENVKKDDYVFSTWANHLHALLKGIPPGLVKQRIVDGESMAMNFPDYRFYTSAIVGGICPIATGVARALKAKESPNRVWVFIGDMTCLTGIAHESMLYSLAYDLPITWVIEDNNKSVMTNTRKAWRIDIEQYLKQFEVDCIQTNVDILHYHYESKFPHSGTGTFVSF